MSSAKQKRGSTPRTKSRTSPPSSPPLPPAPLQAKNRGTASPHHYTTELAPSDSRSMPVAVSSTFPLTHTGPEMEPVGIQPEKGPSLVDNNRDTDHVSAPPALANGPEVVHVTMATPKQQTRWFRRWMARAALMYLGYVIFFVCPNTSDTKSNPICNGMMRVQNWLRPYSKPVTERVDETYRTYAGPYMKQYGQPLYQQSQKYYNQYAHPHVNKAFTAVYPDSVKAHVDRAHENIRHYQRHAHSTHVKPVVDKVSPHAKFAWDRASLEAHRVFDTVAVFYMAHLNPIVQHPWMMIRDAADNVKESLAKQTDEIWGTHYSEHGPSKDSRARRRAAEKKAKELKHQAKHSKKDAEARAEEMKYQAKRTKEDAEARAEDIKHQAKRTKEDAEAHVDSIKDTLLKKANDAQKMAGDYAASAQKKAEEYSNTIKTAMVGTAGEVKKKAEEQQVKVPKATEEAKKTASEKGRSAQRTAEEFVETVSESIKSNAYEAQRAVGEEAEYLKKMSDEKAHEAGRLSEHIKMSIIEKAHKAKEALARQAESIRHSANDQVEWVHGAGVHLKDRVVGASYEAKESVEQEAEDLSKTAREKKRKMERMTEQEAAAWKAAAIEKEEEAQKMADKSKYKAQKAFDASSREAEGMKDKVVKSFKDAEKAAEEYAEGVMKSARGYARGAKGKAHEETINVQNSADQIVMEGKDQAKKAKDNVAYQAKEATEQAKRAKETAKDKTHDAHMASKATLAAMLASIENTFGQFHSYEDTETKNLWNQLQDAINEHITGAKKSAYDLETANREAYETFESYVRDWKHQDGSLEDRLAKLKQQSAESSKKIGTKTEESQKAAKSKFNALSTDVGKYLSGLKDFLADRLAASKETVVSDMSVFKDTSSKSDDKTVRTRFAELEEMARNKLEESSEDAQMKAQKLLDQVDEIWAESENKSQDYILRMRELTQQTIDEANQMSDKSKFKAHSVKNKVEEKVGEKVHGMLPKESSEEDDPNVQIANEEPGSGHRNHRL